MDTCSICGVDLGELVALKHAVAAELVGGLKALVAGRQPAVVVLAHESANALLISARARW